MRSIQASMKTLIGELPSNWIGWLSNHAFKWLPDTMVPSRSKRT